VFLDPLPSGVGCERCHGPGQKHATSLRPEDIVNPAHLSSARQLDVCVQCHESNHSMLRADRGEFSYRPGQPLGEYRVNFVDDPPAADRFPLLAHPERMVRSACWRASGGKLVCTTCHDPHKSSFEQPASWWDAKCDQCHHDHPCTETADARAAQLGHCVPCHMRAGSPTSPTLVTVTDHWIQKRPPPIRPGSDKPERLVAWPDLVSDPATGEDLIALQAVAHAGLGQREEAEALGASVAGEGLHVPQLYQWLASRYGAANQPWNAARAFATLLRFAPDDAPGLYGYARVMLDRGPDGAVDATHALDRMLALDADDPTALEMKGTFLFRSGRIEDARPLFARAAALGPSSSTAHVALGALARREGRDTDAIGELEAARRIEPGDAWILDRLHDAYVKAGDTTHARDIERARAYFVAKQGLASTDATRWLPDAWR
jgi:Tfp pilus assembly protein PilF